MFQEVISQWIYPYIDALAWFLVLITTVIVGSIIGSIIFKGGNGWCRGVWIDRFLKKWEAFLFFIIAIVVVAIIVMYLQPILRELLFVWAGNIPLVFIGIVFFAYIYFCQERGYKITLKAILCFIIPIIVLII